MYCKMVTKIRLVNKSIISHSYNFFMVKTLKIYSWLPWWCNGLESTCQCRGHGFKPWSGKNPHAVEQLSLCATTTEARTPRTHAPQQEKPMQ